MPKIPLYYTFGNHMHWVDMEWLWGYHVLPGSVRDMIRFCREAGVKGNVNFDGIGYEKLAAEDPEALAELREAVQSGLIEPVGCSYGQPYGLFHGGESNVRQRIYGVRAVMRLLGVRPRTFWEEEFDFFPQLPQMLKGVGFTGASLFFQWTWHTPEVPKEEEAVVLWEGHDGTRLPCATRNRLNLHQWPEDMDILLRDLAGEELSDRPRLILQWLELMPSPDWMCRSELLLPKMRDLLGDERFDITPCTLGEFLSLHGAGAPVRRYGMDDVWHGLSLGKNGDRMREWSRRCESELLLAEGLSAMMGLFGRPYAQWDVYPTWELEEAWRELLSAQHHDNDECEGLCGHVGVASYSRSLDLAQHVSRANWKVLEARVEAPEAAKIIYNPLGWPQQVRTSDPENPLQTVPGFGYVSFVEQKGARSTAWRIEGQEAIYQGGSKALKVDLLSATVSVLPLLQAVGLEGEGEVKNPSSSAWQLFELMRGPERLEIGPGFQLIQEGHQKPSVSGSGLKWSVFSDDMTFHFKLMVVEDVPAFPHVTLALTAVLPKLDPGFAGAFSIRFPWTTALTNLEADQPYGVSRVSAEGEFLRKYPEGDWMTSPQWFEHVKRPFTALTFVNATNPNGEGVQITHTDHQQWFRDEDGALRCVLNLYDPWDGDHFEDFFAGSFGIDFHSGRTHSELWRNAQEFLSPPIELTKAGERGDMPPEFSSLRCAPENVAITAFYRETEDYAGKNVVSYAGRGIGYPYVIRLLELDGMISDVRLQVAGTVSAAHKTNLLGEPEVQLEPRVHGSGLRPSAHLNGITSELKFSMGPHEIATLYLDIEEGRKQTRDLDAKREVWATVHRTTTDQPSS